MLTDKERDRLLTGLDCAAACLRAAEADVRYGYLADAAQAVANCEAALARVRESLEPVRGR
jgi:hypothetical protein